MSGEREREPAPVAGVDAGEAAELDGLGYAAALAELERILGELEGEAVDLDHLAERVRRAAVLIRWCRSRIAATKLEIETVVADLERLADDG
jgi:exodeoxyribonuclease VII small subunit